MKRTPQQHTGRVVALAAAFFGAFAVLGAVYGVYARLSPETLAALVCFAVGYTIATCLADRELRAWIRERARGLAATLRRPVAARATKAAGKSPGGKPAAL